MTGAQVGHKDAFNLLPDYDHIGVFFCLVCQRVVVVTPLVSMIESYCFIPAGVSGCYGHRTRQRRQIKADSSGNANSALCLLNSKSIPALADEYASLWELLAYMRIHPIYPAFTEQRDNYRLVIVEALVGITSCCRVKKEVGWICGSDLGYRFWDLMSASSHHALQASNSITY